MDFDRRDLISELSSLRASIADLHNHKETTAYAAFTLNVTAAAWLSQKQDADLSTILLLLIGAAALHVAMRFQLIQRKHCAQFYQVYTASIRELMAGTDDRIRMEIINSWVWPTCKPVKLGWVRYVIWTPWQTFYAADINYPTYEVVHRNIVSTSEAVVQRKRSSLIEKIPTLASLLCCAYILFSAARELFMFHFFSLETI